jgi:hypothetical protein
MHGSKSKIPSKKNLVMQRCVGGNNSGVKVLKDKYPLMYVVLKGWEDNHEI